MNKLFLFIIAIFTFTTATAQYRGDGSDKTIFVSVGGEVGAPSNTPYSVSYGGSAQAEIKVIPQLGVTFAGQYVAYKYKGSLYAGNSDHPSFVPFKAGLRYYTSSAFYLAGEAGSTIQTNSGAGNLFVYSLGFGFEIPLDKNNDVEIGFAYQNYAQSQYQTTALKVAYRIGW